MPNQHTSLPPVERFAEQVIPEPMSGCHLWIGAATVDGYGTFGMGGRTRRAHRVAWEFANGPIPADTMVLHGCDNPACVNVLHLHLGDNRANMKEMVARGRSLHRQKTHCPSGHQYTPENTVVSGDCGWRQCRLCKNASTRRRLAKQRASRNAYRRETGYKVDTSNWQRRLAVACINGHPWDEANTYWYRGKRCCRACNASRKRGQAPPPEAEKKGGEK